MLRQGEDFMGDKFGLSLCDQEDPMEILAQLEDAIDWLRGTDVGQSCGPSFFYLVVD